MDRGPEKNQIIYCYKDTRLILMFDNMQYTY